MADDVPKPAILVVEDESILRMVAADMLDEAGYHVIEAGSGDEGLAALDGGMPIAGLFTDVQTPGNTDGFALAKITHERFPGAAILVVSGAAKPGEGDLPPGAMFLGKPYSGRAVLRTLDELLGRESR